MDEPAGVDSPAIRSEGQVIDPHRDVAAARPLGEILGQLRR